jgi:hypothetical protein
MRARSAVAAQVLAHCAWLRSRHRGVRVQRAAHRLHGGRRAQVAGRHPVLVDRCWCRAALCRAGERVGAPDASALPADEGGDETASLAIRKLSLMASVNPYRVRPNGAKVRGSASPISFLQGETAELTLLLTGAPGRSRRGPPVRGLQSRRARQRHCGGSCAQSPRYCTQGRPVTRVFTPLPSQLDDIPVASPVVGDFSNDGWNDLIIVGAHRCPVAGAPPADTTCAQRVRVSAGAPTGSTIVPDPRRNRGAGTGRHVCVPRGRRARAVPAGQGGARVTLLSTRAIIVRAPRSHEHPHRCRTCNQAGLAGSTLFLANALLQLQRMFAYVSRLL